MTVPPSDYLVVSSVIDGNVTTSFAEMRDAVVGALRLTRWPLVANTRERNPDPLNLVTR
jgi:hypothetical protein